MLDFDEVVSEYHPAAGEFVKGNPVPYKDLFSHREDVTLANPFGPVARGWDRVAETMERATADYRDGEVMGFENVTTFVADDVAYMGESSPRLLGGDKVSADLGQAIEQDHKSWPQAFNSGPIATILTVQLKKGNDEQDKTGIHRGSRRTRLDCALGGAVWFPGAKRDPDRQ